MTNVLPYLNRAWRPDFNCWDLIRELYANEFNISLETHAIAVASAIHAANQEVAAEAAKTDVWRVVEGAVLGDVALFGKRGKTYHVGFMLTPSTVLHLPAMSPSAAVPLCRVIQQFTSLTFYRHASLLPSS